jgi:hypothetical protein
MLIQQNWQRKGEGKVGKGGERGGGREGQLMQERMITRQRKSMYQTLEHTYSQVLLHAISSLVPFGANPNPA